LLEGEADTSGTTGAAASRAAALRGNAGSEHGDIHHRYDAGCGYLSYA
jgi:hypothetical protein